MILAVDVHYTDQGACVAALAFQDWTDAVPQQQYISHITHIAEYVPGEFYRRELPCIMQLLTEHHLQPDIIIIDGYVYLDGNSRPGLGLHLYHALNAEVAVVGVAKTSFCAIEPAYWVYRGGSQKPLYVTSKGADLATIQAHVSSMHGKFRMPTLLKLVDQLCRAMAQQSAQQTC